MEMVKQDNRRELSAKVTTKDVFSSLFDCLFIFLFETMFVEFVGILHGKPEVCKIVSYLFAANLSVRISCLINSY